MPTTVDSLPPPTLLPPPDLSGLSRGLRVIALGGGRGGVGKTLLTVNLGVYFAQLGREVVLCDLDPFGSGMHAVLGLEKPPLATRRRTDEGLGTPVATLVPGLRLLPTPYDPFTATPLRPSRASRLLAQLRALKVDYVLVNLGASLWPAALDMLLTSDLGVCVTTPEPIAVEATYAVLRALFARVVRRALMRERFMMKTIEKAISSLPPLATPPEIIEAVARIDDKVGRAVAQQTSRVTPHIVVNQARIRADLELGPAMCGVCERFLGLGVGYLGHIEHDDAVWLTIRRRQPLLIDGPTSKSARNVERVARRILALVQSRPLEVTPPKSPGERTLYDVLSVSRTAADDEIRRAYKRQRDVFHEGGQPVLSVVSEPALAAERARIEEAYDTLLDPARRRSYDLTTFPEDAPVSAPPTRAADEARQAELAALQAELAREVRAETEFSGALLRRAREAQGIELPEIAQRTKISLTHLKAIEDERPADLPALVYVQGFVREYARCLKLDPAQVAKTYIRRLR